VGNGSSPRKRDGVHLSRWIALRKAEADNLHGHSVGGADAAAALAKFAGSSSLGEGKLLRRFMAADRLGSVIFMDRREREDDAGSL